MEYSLCGVRLRLTGGGEAVLARSMQSLFSLQTVAPGTESALEVRIDDRLEEAIAGEIEFDSPGLTSIRTARGYHLRARGSFLSLDLRAGSAVGSLSHSFLTSSLEEQRGLILFTLLLLLSGRGLYALHAGGVVSPDGQGVLLVGFSGSGKTTLTCALARSGWSYLSDDAVMLKRAPGGVEALAFGRPFHCAPALFRHFPELGTGNDGTAGGKRLVEVSTHYPGLFRSRMRPTAVLFPEIVAEPDSRAIRLSRTETLLQLVRNGSGLLRDRASMAAQMALLSEVAMSARGFRLLHGTDVHRNPEVLAATLGRLIHAEGDSNALSSAA